MAIKEIEMPAAESLDSRYQAVRQRIGQAAAKSGRQASEVLLVAVTKHAEADQVRSLIQLGHRDFGENRVQHLLQHAAMVEEHMARRRVLPRARHAHDGDVLLSAPGSADAIRWHMIGHLQRNKAKKAVEFCRLIHSVDSLRLAEEVQAIALKQERVVEVLVQVNCSAEQSKFGCPLPAAIHLAEQIDTMVFVRVRGLMTMAPYSTDPEAARPTFVRCRELFEEVRRTGVGEGKFNILSMGMSGDFEVAISEGANVVRVGTAIFGEPKNPVADDEEEDD